MTTPPEIPEAVVEKAARAAHETVSHLPWEILEPGEKMRTIAISRAALEAAAPSLRAQGMEEAKKVVVDRLLAYDEMAAQLAMITILARAAEIEGGKG